MATRDPRDSCGDLEAAADAGDWELIRGTRYAARWDQDDELDTPTDYGWIGEDRSGVWLAVHPDAALLERPYLWSLLGNWADGARKPSVRDSAYVRTCKRALNAARYRARAARYKRPSD